MAAPYKPRKPGSLKQACAQLVERCGGQTVVAKLWKCSPQNVARMTDDDHAQNPPRADQVALLESLCKEPIFASYLAGRLNCVVEPMGQCAPEALPIILGRITTETGELLSAAGKDVSAGKLSATNAATVLADTSELVCALLLLRGAARQVLEKGAA